MDFATLDIAAWLFVGAAALLGGGALRLRRRALRRAEADLESLRDALWESLEREQRARASGERALAAARAGADGAAHVRSRFLATVTHELRTPLSGVIGAADLLLDSALAPDQRTYAEAVRTSGAAMLSLVDELLDVSRIEAGRVVLRHAVFDVAELVEGVAELLAPRAQAKGLDLAVRISTDAPTRIVGDAARLRQILLNLAGNAVKFTVSGGVGLRIDAVEGALRFMVIDTGPGFDPADAGRLFEEFERASDDPAEAGAGLGLAISAKIAAAMGATLAADARPGDGASFTLTLPAAQGLAPLAEPSAALAGRRIVVASATPFGGPWLAERLAESGAQARLGAAADPEAFEVEVRAFGADTALIDRAATLAPSALAGAARRGGASRVLALLAPSERSELPGLAADGFDGFLVKPVRIGSLASRLNDPRQIISPPALEAARAVAFPEAAGLRVLLADDDPVNALIALAHLRRLGHAVVQTDDGLAAFSIFEADVFDAVLLDLRMPGLDGFSTARRMRAFETAAGREPALLVALTANVSAADRAAALEAGMDELLPKPLDPRRLANLLAPRMSGRSKVA